MSTRKGKPSGRNKPEGTGVPQNLSPENISRTEEVAGKYTDDEGNISEGVKTTHPNRNTDKLPATNAHGYKN